MVVALYLDLFSKNLNLNLKKLKILVDNFKNFSSSFLPIVFMVASTLHTIFCLFLLGIFYLFFKNSTSNEEDDIYNWILEIHENEKKRGPMPKEFYPKNIFRTQKPQVKLMKLMGKNIRELTNEKFLKKHFRSSPKISITTDSTTLSRSPIRDRNLIIKQYHQSPRKNIYTKTQFQTYKSPIAKTPDSTSTDESEPEVRVQQLYGPVLRTLTRLYKSPRNRPKSPAESDYPFQYHYH